VNPGARIKSWHGASRVFGKSFSRGATPQQSAERFIAESLPLFGFDSTSLQPRARFLDDGNAVPLMYDKETGQYKFTALYYTQYQDGVEVYGTRLTLLVRNEPNHPLVLAGAALRDLGGFRVAPGRVNAIRYDRAFSQVRARFGK